MVLLKQSEFYHLNLFKVANWHVACHMVQIFHCDIALQIGTIRVTEITFEICKHISVNIKIAIY